MGGDRRVLRADGLHFMEATQKTLRFDPYRPPQLVGFLRKETSATKEVQSASYSLEKENISMIYSAESVNWPRRQSRHVLFLRKLTIIFPPAVPYPVSQAKLERYVAIDPAPGQK